MNFNNNILPFEMALHIFEFLPDQSLASNLLVCKYWQFANNHILKERYKNLEKFILSGDLNSSGELLKNKYLINYMNVYASERLVLKSEEFSDELSNLFLTLRVLIRHCAHSKMPEIMSKAFKFASFVQRYSLLDFAPNPGPKSYWKHILNDLFSVANTDNYFKIFYIIEDSPSEIRTEQAKYFIRFILNKDSGCWKAATTLLLLASLIYLDQERLQELKAKIAKIDMLRLDSKFTSEYELDLEFLKKICREVIALILEIEEFEYLEDALSPILGRSYKKVCADYYDDDNFCFEYSSMDESEFNDLMEGSDGMEGDD